MRSCSTADRSTLGSTSHFFPALIEKAAGIKFKYVSYEGLAPRMNAILGGHIDLTDSNLTQKGKVEAGQLKFIAIGTDKRSPEMPNVPTLKELGVNVSYTVSRGVLAPERFIRTNVVGTQVLLDAARSARALARQLFYCWRT